MDDRETEPPLSAGDALPPTDTKRWVARRKAVVVSAVRRGTISLEEACCRYQLSIEEFHAWQRAIERARGPRPVCHPAAESTAIFRPPASPSHAIERSGARES